MLADPGVTPSALAQAAASLDAALPHLGTKLLLGV